MGPFIDDIVMYVTSKGSALSVTRRLARPHQSKHRHLVAVLQMGQLAFLRSHGSTHCSWNPCRHGRLSVNSPVVTGSIQIGQLTESSLAGHEGSAAISLAVIPIGWGPGKVTDIWS